MFWIYLYTILFFSLNVASKPYFGANIEKEVEEVSSVALESYKSAKSKEELFNNIHSLEDIYAINGREKYIRNGLYHLLEGMPPSFNLHKSLSIFDKTITSINNLYDKLLNLTVLPKQSKNSNLENFLTNLTSNNDENLYNLMNILHQQIIGHPHVKTTAFSILKNIFKTNLGICSLEASPQGMISVIFEIIMLIIMKAYLLLQFACVYLKKGDMTEIHAQHMNRIGEIATAVKPFLSIASRHLWACDPIGNYEEDKTYARFKQTFTYMIVRKEEIGDGLKFVCKQKCHQLQFQSHYLCAGTLHWCHFYGHFLKVCHADPFSFRRLLYTLDIESSILRGKKVQCKANNIEFLTSNFVYEEMKCTWCFCACEYTKESHRFISLLPVTSTILLNKIITGIRFQKVDKVLYLQIQEGILINDGCIEPGSEKWKEIELVHNHEIVHLQSSREYYSLHWNGRYLDPDELFVPPRHVMTGVGIIFYNNGHMGFTIRATRFKFNGKSMYPESSHWIKTTMNEHRKYVYSDVDPDIPTLSQEQSVPVMNRDIYIPFRPSSNIKDLGQETVPFIDLLPVKSFPPVPFVGLALILKKQRGHGGFLAWRGVTYNIYDR